ncbi:hypothetical protein LEN26_003048 [Aphanomyces euteiches]|nr:hypothetical protein AeMF1_013685 [Aphanomyces euteiches]KAH9158322.1 hypothetical protein LEN26_003048 [Aphanomyces euteiches]KAH9188173.1 hypothetical protein AeNC1_009856 [Aphanomyces euteiches]
MKIASSLLLSFIAVTNAAISLTTCTSLQGVAIPCLNDTTKGNLTNLESSSNQTYNFSNLNITAIQDLPPDAKYVDLSYNQISEISRGLPSTLSFLNLSHNALLGNWTKTPLEVSTLDVSYNEGGLPWISDNMTWPKFLSKVARLYVCCFSRNSRLIVPICLQCVPREPVGHRHLDRPELPRLSILVARLVSRLFFSNLWALDREVSDNPKLVIRGDNNAIQFINNTINMIADAISYDDTLKACGNVAEKVVKLNNTPLVPHSTQGEARHGPPPPDKQFSVCLLNFTDMGYTPPTSAAAIESVEGIAVGLISLAVFFLGH